MNSPQKARVYHAINRSQDNSPLTKFFDKDYNLKTDPTAFIEVASNPSVGDLLNYFLARTVDKVVDKTDLRDVFEDLDYAAKELRKAADAVGSL